VTAGLRRACLSCGRPVRNASRCPACAPTTTTARGYGTRHQKLRAMWAPLVARGEVKCARCGRLIAPGTAWDLGHSDDRLAYRGPEHANKCNRAAGGRTQLKRAI
jgi:hypothetical protein